LVYRALQMLILNAGRLQIRPGGSIYIPSVIVETNFNLRLFFLYTYNMVPPTEMTFSLVM